MRRLICSSRLRLEGAEPLPSSMKWPDDRCLLTDLQQAIILRLGVASARLVGNLAR